MRYASPRPAPASSRPSTASDQPSSFVLDADGYRATARRIADEMRALPPVEDALEAIT